MRKNELMDMLARQEGNPVIVLSCDEEGNEFAEMDKGCTPEIDTQGRDILILYPSGWRLVDIAD